MARERCGAPTFHGTPCTSQKLPGFDYCLRHLPEDQCDAAARDGYVRCSAIVRTEQNPRHGERCGNYALGGNTVCAYHLDKAEWLVPTTPRARSLVYKIHRMAENEGVDTTRVANPLQELLVIADEAVRLKDELKRRVVALKEDEWRYEGVAGEQIRGEILLYERALDRAARLLAQLTRLGIEERLARVTERQGYLINKALELALEESGVPIDKQDQIRESVARHLRAVE